MMESNKNYDAGFSSLGRSELPKSLSYSTGRPCVNSLLQALFWTPEFRNGIYRYKHKEQGKCTDGTLHLAHELQRLFLGMQFTECKVPDTFHIRTCIGQGEFFQESFNELLNKLELDLKRTGDDVLNTKLLRPFTGQMCDYVVCQRCKDIDKRIVVFYDVPLPVSKTEHGAEFVTQSLQAFIEPQPLVGRDRSMCANCKRKEDATKGFSFRNLPKIMIFQLTNDASEMAACCCPADIDLAFLLDYNSRRTKYELYAMLLQIGRPQNGAYLAYIKVTEGQCAWHCFQDNNVTPVSDENMAKMLTGPSSRISLAKSFMLMYRTSSEPKEKFFDEKDFEEHLLSELSTLVDRRHGIRGGHEGSLEQRKTPVDQSSNGFTAGKDHVADVSQNTITSASDVTQPVVHGALLKRTWTHYMNSLLQVLFWTPEFRHAINTYQENELNSSRAASCANLPYQLRRLFRQMQTSGPADSSTACDVTDCLRLNGMEGRDVADFMSDLLNRLERDSVDLRKCFNWEMYDYIKCKQCPSVNRIAMRFFTGAITTKLPQANCASDSLVNAVEEVLGAHVRRWTSQPHCPECNAKQALTENPRFMILPAILIFRLRREEDISGPADVTPNDRVECPASLDVGLLQSLNMATFETESTYELYAMLVSCAGRRYADYFAYINISMDGSTSNWYRFQDSDVQPVAQEDVEEAYRGSRPVGKHSGCDSSRGNAYMLIYRLKTDGNEEHVEKKQANKEVGSHIHSDEEKRHDNRHRNSQQERDAKAKRDEAPDSSSCSFYNTKELVEPHRNFRGLMNQGATCYLNSLLQALFWTPEFRNSIYRYKHTAAVGEANNLPYQLQRLFLEMQGSKSTVLHTVGVTQCLGTEVTTQRDIQEFFHELLERLESDLLQTRQNDIAIRRHFTGQMHDYVTCKRCRVMDGRDLEFIAVPLVVKSFKGDLNQSVGKCLEEFIKAQDLEGENQSFCTRCDRKQDASKGLNFKVLPKILTLQLMRFEIDRMHRDIKLNDRVECPNYINLDFLLDPESARPNETLYELYAMLLHYGGTRSGDYFAFIKVVRGEPGQWYCFNDAQVSRIAEDDLKEACGFDITPGSYRPQYSRQANAYVLMYRQTSDCDEHDNDEGFLEENKFPTHLKDTLTKLRKEREFPESASQSPSGGLYRERYTSDGQPREPGGGRVPGDQLGMMSTGSKSQDGPLANQPLSDRNKGQSLSGSTKEMSHAGGNILLSDNQRVGVPGEQEKPPERFPLNKPRPPAVPMLHGDQKDPQGMKCHTESQAPDSQDQLEGEFAKLDLHQDKHEKDRDSGPPLASNIENYIKPSQVHGTTYGTDIDRLIVSGQYRGPGIDISHGRRIATYSDVVRCDIPARLTGSQAYAKDSGLSDTMVYKSETHMSLKADASPHRVRSCLSQKTKAHGPYTKPPRKH